MTIKDFTEASARKSNMRLFHFKQRVDDVLGAAETVGSNQHHILEKLLPQIEKRYVEKQWADFTPVAHAYLAVLEDSLGSEHHEVGLSFEDAFAPYLSGLHEDDIALLQADHDRAYGDHAAELELAERLHEEQPRPCFIPKDYA